MDKGKGSKWRKVVVIIGIVCVFFVVVMFLTKTLVEEVAPRFTNIIVSKVNGDDIKEENYKDTLEEALASQQALTPWQQVIAEEIFRMRKGDCMCIVYRATSEKEDAFVVANLRVIEKDGKEVYACPSVSVGTIDDNDKSFNELIAKQSEELARGEITGIANMAYAQFINSASTDGMNDNRLIVYGVTSEAFLNEGESMYHLQIDGKSPDKVVECESRGGTYYFWYYDDLPNASAITLEQVTLKEE